MTTKYRNRLSELRLQVMEEMRAVGIATADENTIDRLLRPFLAAQHLGPNFNALEPHHQLACIAFLEGVQREMRLRRPVYETDSPISAVMVKVVMTVALTLALMFFDSIEYPADAKPDATTLLLQLRH